MSVFIKILYLVLVLAVGAVLGAVVAGYFRIRRHMNGKGAVPVPPPAKTTEVEEEIPQ